MAVSPELDHGYRLPTSVFERLELHLPSCSPPDVAPVAAVDQLRRALILVAETSCARPNELTRINSLRLSSLLFFATGSEWRSLPEEGPTRRVPCAVSPRSSEVWAVAQLRPRDTCAELKACQKFLKNLRDRCNNHAEMLIVATWAFEAEHCLQTACSELMPSNSDNCSGSYHPE